MSIMTIVEQMIVICFLILIGGILYRKKILKDLTIKDISALIVNITNPALLLHSALSAQEHIPIEKVMSSIGLFTLCYMSAYLIGWIISIIMHIPKEKRYAYQMMTVYGNVGFIGIPLALAVLGNQSLIYVSINNLVYNILFYTSGMMILNKRVADSEKSDHNKKSGGCSGLIRKVVNVGTVSAILTIVIYLMNPPVPLVVSDTLNYAGSATTFLSMLVLGASVAAMPFRKIFTDPKIYLFTLLRMVVMPILIILAIRPWVTDPLLLKVTALLIAVPAGNLPMIVSRELGLEEEDFAKGILVTTMLSPITITLVMMILK